MNKDILEKLDNEEWVFSTKNKVKKNEIERLNDFINNQKDIDPEFNKIISENFWELVDNEPRKYKSPVVERLYKKMENDPWYVKLKRWFMVEKWVLICRTRKFWDKSYEHYIFKKK